MAYSEGQWAWQDGPPPSLLPTTPEEDGGKKTMLLACPPSCFSRLFSLFSAPLSPPSALDVGEGFPQASLSKTHLCLRCQEWPWYPFLGIHLGFLTVVLFWGERGAHAEFPKAYVWRGTTSASLGPWLCPTPALTQVQMFTGSLLPTPLCRSEAPKEKAQEAREIPPFLETKPTCSFS